MSAYLARLKQLEDGKSYHHAPDTLPPKPPEPPFAGFDSTGTGRIEKIIDDAANWRWLVCFAERSLIVAVTPEATRAEIMEMYSAALEAKPIEDDDTLEGLI